MMKNTWMFVLLALPILFSCEDDDDGDVTPPEVPEGVAIMEDDLLGEWRVTRLIDDNENETDDLAPFTLDFQQDGVLVISAGDDSITAGWTLNSDRTVLELSIDDADAASIDPEDELDELDDDWLIVNQTDTSLEMIENDDDDNDRDELTLTRI